MGFFVVYEYGWYMRLEPEAPENKEHSDYVFRVFRAKREASPTTGARQDEMARKCFLSALPSPAQYPLLARAHLLVLAMSASDPAARPADALLELGDNTPHMVSTSRFSLNGNGPAYPLVAGERRDVSPRGQSLRISRQSPLEIRRQIMPHAALYDLVLSHIQSIPRWV